MEKCTFCTQRIAEAKIEAKNAWVQTNPAERETPDRVPIEDGRIVTACQQACPTEAIVFGDLADPASRVSQLQRQQRSYEMLEELNVKARLKYMAKVRNPHARFESVTSKAGHGAGGHGDDSHDAEEAAGH
jgi:Fe-S-cluster-containing dehydrogenase component